MMDPYCLWMIISYALACFIAAWSHSIWGLLCGLLATCAAWLGFWIAWLLADLDAVICLRA